VLLLIVRHASFLIERLQCIEDGSYRWGDILNQPDRTNNNNYAALHYAVEVENAEMIQILLELGSKVDIKFFKSLSKKLHVDKGSPIKCRDKRAKRPAFGKMA